MIDETWHPPDPVDDRPPMPWWAKLIVLLMLGAGVYGLWLIFTEPPADHDLFCVQLCYPMPCCIFCGPIVFGDRDAVIEECDCSHRKNPHLEAWREWAVENGYFECGTGDTGISDYTGP